jgi:hypothetical protein
VCRLTAGVSWCVQMDQPRDAYQASFDTVAGEWMTVNLPWHQFVPVSKGVVAYGAPPINPSQISTIGLLYSRFTYNGAPNPNCKPGVRLCRNKLLICC